MKDDSVRYLIMLNKKLKRELEEEAAELQLPLAAYIRIILMSRNNVKIGVCHESNKDN